METDAVPFELEKTVPACPFPAQSNNLNLFTNNLNTIQDYSYFYDVHDHRKRIAVVFNQYKFREYDYLEKKLSFNKRVGTNKDCRRIVESLEKLKFNVTALQDPTVSAINGKIREMAAMTSEEVSCVVVVVMTHGDSGGILYATDGVYSQENLSHPFRDAPALAGVPKLFILQACRGSNTDAGFAVEDSIDGIEETEKEENYTVPTMADMLWMYSTFENYVSWREEDGTWFIQALCQMLDRCGTQQDILQLLTQVNCAVARNFSSQTPAATQTHRMKQMPQVTYTLTKTLSFQPPSQQQTINE